MRPSESLYTASPIDTSQHKPLSSPFRPSFKYFSWHTSLVGLAGTTVMMFFISPLFSAVSVLLCCSLVFALNFLSPIKNKAGACRVTHLLAD